MPERSFLTAAAAILLAASGCGSSRLESYPEFPAQKARLGRSMIFADFLLLRAAESDTSSVDLRATKETADTLLHFVQERLDAKGYNVTGRLLSSVGLLLDSTVTANVSRTSGLDGEEEDAALVFRPPFYLYQALRRDPDLTALVASLYRRLALLEDDAAPPVMDEAVRLGRAFGDGMYFILLGGGFEVPPGMQDAPRPAPASEAGMKIGYHAVSQASLHLFVLDAGAGGVLWTDHRVAKGGAMYAEKFIRMAERLLEDLP